ncbi:MAG: hypothetical protein IPG49_01545 [Proteobacteria bacterium]|nr:hypothetical protein [Pseudomonadota bacterium]
MNETPPTRGSSRRSAYLQAVATDNTIPISPQALELWMRDLENPLRWFVRPLLQFVFAVLLHLTWAFKRLPLPQFRAHGLLQWTICAFCRTFVAPEANMLILRHYATESNILNFLRDNNPGARPAPLTLYPRSVDDMRSQTFVDHDQELFRMIRDLGSWTPPSRSAAPADLAWTHWRQVDIRDQGHPKRFTQVLDFETSHALFMCLFCLLLTRDEYRDAINGFNLDQSMAIRVGQLIGDPTAAELAYNKYPQYMVGPWNLGQRFLMHGFFTEYLHARLEAFRAGEQPATS